MRIGLEAHPREYLRVPVAFPVHYRFVAHARSETRVLAGRTVDLSGGGLRLVGPLPDPKWIPELLTESMRVAVAIELATGRFAKALARVVWVDTDQAHAPDIVFGLSFRRIDKPTQSAILDTVIERRLEQISEPIANLA